MTQSTRVILSGGPEGTPRTWELASGDGDVEVKIQRGNGYEHFEFAHAHAELDGELVPVYRWRYRTLIAE